MKGKIITAVCIALLFIPTYIAVSFYITARSSPVSGGAVSKMVINDLDGASFAFNRGQDTAAVTEGVNPAEADAIAFFIKMNEQASSVDSLPEPLRGADCYTVTYYSYDMETSYKYYFSTNASDAFYVKDSGQAYHINEADAKAFISSKYALCLYKEAAAPVMTIAGAETVLPSTMTWKFRLSDGEYSDAVVPRADKREVYDIAGTLNLSFDVQPDYLFVIIQNGEEVIYNDSYSNIGSLNLDQNATLSVGVTAQWYENEERGSYGEAFYSFDCKVHAPSEFYLGATSVYPGDFVAITGKNVEDPSAVIFKSEPDINFTPVFFQDGDYVVALVPISYELDYSSSYTFTITSGSSTSTLTLAVNEKTFKWRDYDISAEIIAATRTQTTLDAFNAAMKPYFDAVENVRYWMPGTLFTIPAQGTDMVQTGIGIYRTLTATNLTYRHPGVDFLVSEGTNVLAACDGKVVFAGTQTLSGRIVVIEHGFGLKSIYCHMSSISVEAGASVKAGDVIGVVGSTGFTKGVNFHFGLYVFETPVSPYNLFKDFQDNTGIVITRP